MAFSEQLADRVRVALANTEGVREQKMFGGLAFMVGEHMATGVLGDSLMVRVGPEGGQFYSEPHAAPMTFTGRPMPTIAHVAPEGIRTDADLRRWVGRGVTFVRTLPPKSRP